MGSYFRIIRIGYFAYDKNVLQSWVPLRMIKNLILFIALFFLYVLIISVLYVIVLIVTNSQITFVFISSIIRNHDALIVSFRYLYLMTYAYFNYHTMWRNHYVLSVMSHLKLLLLDS